MDEHSEFVDHPGHYNWHPKAECIEISQEFNGNLAQVIQYVWRMMFYIMQKDYERAVRDGRKAIKFLEFEIERWEM